MNERVRKLIAADLRRVEGFIVMKEAHIKSEKEMLSEQESELAELHQEAAELQSVLLT